MEKLELEKIANNIRKETISMIHNAKSGHPGGALSATDIFTYLYFNEMNVDPKRQIRFIKGTYSSCTLCSISRKRIFFKRYSYDIQKDGYNSSGAS